jgi:NAD+ synthase
VHERSSACPFNGDSPVYQKAGRVVLYTAWGHDLETVKKIERLLYLAEYKRRQSAPGVKVTRKNFGRHRRYPIVNWFRDPGVVA